MIVVEFNVAEARMAKLRTYNGYKALKAVTLFLL